MMDGDGDDMLMGMTKPILLMVGGDDSIKGMGGDDSLKGRRGDDTLYGGDGDDKLDGRHW